MIFVPFCLIFCFLCEGKTDLMLWFTLLVLKLWVKVLATLVVTLIITWLEQSIFMRQWQSTTAKWLDTTQSFFFICKCLEWLFVMLKYIYTDGVFIVCNSLWPTWNSTMCGRLWVTSYESLWSYQGIKLLKHIILKAISHLWVSSWKFIVIFNFCIAVSWRNS